MAGTNSDTSTGPHIGHHSTGSTRNRPVVADLAGVQGHVVVGVDNSPRGMSVARWAIEVAARNALPFTLVHCCDIDDPHPLGELLEIAVRLRRLYPGVAVHQRIVNGEPTGLLAALSQVAAVVVVGAAGEDAMDPAGSVPLRLVAQAASPVAVVGTGGSATGFITVGVDGSPESMHALEIAASQAERCDAPLQVLMAWLDVMLDQQGHALLMVTDWNAEATRWRERLDLMLVAVRARHPELDVTGELVHDRPVRALLERAPSSRLLVVGRRGHGTVHSMALGSTSQALLVAADCPVLVVPASPISASPASG